MRVLDFIFVTACVTALVALPFTFYFFHRKPIQSGLALGIPIIISFCISEGSQRFVQDRVLEKLGVLRDTYQVPINATPVSQPNDVLLALKTLRWLAPHHSNPVKRINVEVSDGSRHILLSLARDSGNPREYWVYYPKYYITRYNEIGRIVTPVFDQY